MAERIAMIIGAALACALLVGPLAHGPTEAVGLLVYVAALPIMIVTLGWGALDGLAATVLASLAIAALGGLAYGFFAAVSLALPALALSAFSQAPSRITWGPKSAAPSPAPQGKVSLGAMGVLAAAIGAGLTLISVLAIVAEQGGIAKAIEATTAMAETAMRAAMDSAGATYEPAALHDFVVWLVSELPLTCAASITVMLLLNLYLAARAVSFSGRLRRPWVDIPTGFALPFWLAPVFVVALIAAVLLPENVDQPTWIIVGALFCLYLFQGLATLHALTRGLNFRPFALFALYLALAIASVNVFELRINLIATLIALIGLLESLLGIRARAAKSPPKPKT